MCTKFYDCRFIFQSYDWCPKILKLVMWLQTRPFEGQFVIPRLILHMANQCTKLKSLALAVPEMFLGGFKIVHVTWPHPCQGRFFIHRLGLNIINLSTKFEFSSYAHYEEMKGNTKCRNWDVFWRLGVTQGHRQCNRLIEHILFPIQLW